MQDKIYYDELQSHLLEYIPVNFIVSIIVGILKVDDSYSRLDRLLEHCLCNCVELPRECSKMGFHLSSVPKMSLCLSRIYCSVFDRRLPQRPHVDKSSRPPPEPSKCVKCHDACYPVEKPKGRQQVCSDCYNNHRLFKHRSDYVSGDSSPRDFEYLVPKPTRAIQWIARNDPKFLLAIANRIFRIVV